jgi:hypothetical protein
LNLIVVCENISDFTETSDRSKNTGDRSQLIVADIECEEIRELAQVIARYVRVKIRRQIQVVELIRWRTGRIGQLGIQGVWSVTLKTKYNFSALLDPA